MKLAQQKLSLIEASTTPLFNIEWNDSCRPLHENNRENLSVGFHIGNGFILSSINALANEKAHLSIIPDAIYRNEILAKLQDFEVEYISRFYQKDESGEQWILQISDSLEIGLLNDIIKTSGFNHTYYHLYQKNIQHCYIRIVYPRYSIAHLDAFMLHLSDNNYHYDKVTSKHTLLLELELVTLFQHAEIALFKIPEKHKEIIRNLQILEPDFSDNEVTDFYSLQPAPHDYFDRMLSLCKPEGMVCNNTPVTFPGLLPADTSGLRYFINGYSGVFSTGSPYLIYDSVSGKLKVHAVHLQASGNLMNPFSKNIASPIFTISHQLSQITGLYSQLIQT